MNRISFILLGLAALAGCDRQFEVTVNQRSVYDPRIGPGMVRVADPALQGCVSLALSQQVPEATSSELRSLNCANAQVASLDGIERLTGLRFLDLSDNAVTDLTPIETLNELSVVFLPDNQILDISSLLNMPRLTAAVLSGNERIPCEQLDRLESRLGENLSRPIACR